LCARGLRSKQKSRNREEHPSQVSHHGISPLTSEPPVVANWTHVRAKRPLSGTIGMWLS